MIHCSLLLPTVFFLFLFLLGPCFVLVYFAIFLALQSSHEGRENWLLYFNCLLAATCSKYSVPLPHWGEGW